MKTAYEIIESDKLRLSMQYAMILHLSKKYSGKFLNDELVLIDINDENRYNYFSKDITFSHEIGVTLSYAVGNRLDLLFSPSIRYSRSTDTPVSYLVEQRRLSTRISLGIGWEIGR